MKKTAEAVSLGHPDKICDYISSYILDRMLEQDPTVHYAVEVMIKENTVVLGGEISGCTSLLKLKNHIKQALSEIGYTSEYAARWGENTIQPDKLKIINLIGPQSCEISQGICRHGRSDQDGWGDQHGWGDQGVFVGYACQGEGNNSKEQFLARRLNSALYHKAKNSKILGLDIKTQITLDSKGKVETAIAAIPMLKTTDLTDFIIETLGETPKNLIVNGTGTYKCHASIADCGVTGRKLACDFYSVSSPIGGGSPWTKDASKADLTLNLYARYLACRNLKDNDECFVYLSSCIGQSELPSAALKTIKDGKISTQNLKITQTPNEIIDLLGLNKPVFAKLCREGLI